MNREPKQTSALHAAREKGQILPPKEGRFLRGGAEIPRAEILPEKRLAVVEGIAPNKSVFQINVPMSMLRALLMS